MSAEKERLEIHLNELEKMIAETLGRLPAHSIKPPVLMELLRLEDERDLLLKKIGEWP